MTALPLRIVEKVDLDGDCWVWNACLDRSGAGRVFYEGKNRTAYRLLYELLVGPVPDGLELDHLCRNRACVNPDHLEPVTHKQNMERSEPALRTHCPQGHAYTETNTYRHHRGGRMCRRCRKERGSS